MLQAEPSF